MNQKIILRLIILTQIITLFVLMLMPALVRLLSDTWGKSLYTLLLVVSIGLAIALRRALSSVE